MSVAFMEMRSSAVRLGISVVPLKNFFTSVSKNDMFRLSSTVWFTMKRVAFIVPSDSIAPM